VIGEPVEEIFANAVNLSDASKSQFNAALKKYGMTFRIP
jgi:hypothetical protein